MHHHPDHDNGRHGDSEHQGEHRLGAPKNLMHLLRCWRSGINTHSVAMAAPTNGETMLDVGAGMGAGALVAARIPGVRVECLEPSVVMRTILNARRLIHPRRRSITVHPAGAESIPLGDGTVDAATMVNVAHHLNDEVAAISELLRVMRPKAKLVVVEGDFAHGQPPSHGFSMRRKHGDGGHSHGSRTAFELERFVARALEAGFLSSAIEDVHIGDVSVSQVVLTKP